MTRDNSQILADEELRRNWRRDWLSSIQEFADLEQQKIKWLDRTNTNPHWGYVEYMCCYFDDLGLSDGGYGSVESRGYVSHNEAQAVEEFHRLADKHNSPTDDYDLVAILADPEWLALTEAAKRVQAKLVKIISNPAEIEILTRRQVNFGNLLISAP